MANKPLVEKTLDVPPLAYILIAKDLSIDSINPVMAQFLNVLKTDHLSGKSILGYISEEDHEVFGNFLKHLDEPGKYQLWQVLRFIDSNGSRKSLLITGTANFEGQGTTGNYSLMGMPLFEESFPKNFGQDLQKDFFHNKYKSIFDSATVGITILDDKGYIEETNPTFLEHFGFSKEGVINQHYSDLFKDQVKDQFECLVEMIEKSQLSHVKDVVAIIGDDTEHMILEVSLSKIYNNYDCLNKFMLITEDITNQQDTHAALLQSEKLALTGRLAASLAHEINNPLQTSIGCLGLAEELLNDDDRDLSIYIKMAIEEIQRSARIVKRLRDLNRKADPSDKSPVNIQNIIETVLILTKNRLHDRKIVPIFPYQGPPIFAWASKDQLQQVLLNLIINAIDALPEGGHIYLDILHTNDPKGIMIKVRDTGIGIEPEAMTRLFDPFFTTKRDGLGLGLYICKQIIEDHDGSLTVKSDPGKGTEFSIWLPGLDVSKYEE